MPKRIFAAVNVSLETVRRLTELQRTLHREVSPALRVSWVAPANQHVTLKFYGQVHDAQVEAAMTALRRAAEREPAFRLVTRGVGAFPDTLRPRVIWAGLAEGVDRLQALRDRLEETSLALGFAREEKPFHAHVTLGRVRDGREGAEAALAGHVSFEGLASAVNELVLYESRLQRAGAEYVALARVPLQDPLTIPEGTESPVSQPGDPPEEGNS
jgi:RNA 2',3'-cyclic 3'-phosphodiesterase